MPSSLSALGGIPYSPNTSSLSQLLMQQGQNRANAALQGGQIWGNFAQNLGQTIAGGIQDYQQQKVMQQRAQAEQMKQQREAEKQAQEFEFRQHEQKLADAEAIRRADESAATLAAKRAELAQVHADTLGDIGSGLQGHLNDPDGGVGAALFAIDKYKDALGDDAPKYAQLIQSDPTQLRTLVERALSSSPKQQKIARERADAEAARAEAGIDNARADKQLGFEARRVALAEQQARSGGDGKAGWVMRNGTAIHIPDSQIQPGDTPYESARTGMKKIPAGSAEKLADLDTSLGEAAAVKAALSGTAGTGAVSRAGALLPNVVTEYTGWGADAKSRQATIDRVKQVIGKALEEGVLRKEDEAKYEKILPTIGDPPSVVTSKLAGLESAIKRKKANDIDALEDAGYDMAQFRARAAAAPAPDAGGWSNVGGLKVRVKP